MIQAWLFPVYRSENVIFTCLTPMGFESFTLHCIFHNILSHFIFLSFLLFLAISLSIISPISLLFLLSLISVSRNGVLSKLLTPTLLFPCMLQYILPFSKLQGEKFINTYSTLLLNLFFSLDVEWDFPLGIMLNQRTWNSSTNNNRTLLCIKISEHIFE